MTAIFGGGSVPGPVASLLEHLTDTDVGQEELWLSWELARMTGQQDPEAQRALVLLILASWARVRQGSTRLDLGPELDGELRALGAGPDDVRAVRGLAGQLLAGPVGPELARVVGPPEAGRPLIVDHGHLHHQRLFALERAVAAGMAARLAVAPAWTPAQVAAALADVASRPTLVGTRPLALTDEQQAAVEAAVTGGLTVVTGGPGTGKTSIVVGILRVLVRLDPGLAGGVALAAPTGKAADRMAASVGSALAAIADPGPGDLALLAQPPEASTLHRLLGYSPRSDRFRHHRRHLLPLGMVIADEASMLDLHLADHLVQALPEGARLVLLGDADQLPSVDAGAVLADLCSEGAGPAVGGAVRRLTRSWRMDPADPAGRAILLGAEGVRMGRLVPPLDGSGTDAEGEEGLRLLPAGRAEVQRFLLGWERRHLRALPGWERTVALTHDLDPAAPDPGHLQGLRRLVEHYDRARILCVTRVEPERGSVAVNALFHERMPPATRLGPGALCLGEPVMVTANDYRFGLFNGDTGVVVRARTGAGAPGAVAVFFRGEGFSAIPVEALRGRLEAAWAVTVHKAQGSEYDHVALVLPREDVRLLTREIVYTAMTRARRSVAILGTPELLRLAVSRRVSRWTALPEALVEATPAPPAAAAS